MVHFHGFFPSANIGGDDNNNKGDPEPQVKEEQMERSTRCVGFNCAGRYKLDRNTHYIGICTGKYIRRGVNVVLVLVQVGTVG